jgi:hypothetical protein
MLFSQCLIDQQRRQVVAITLTLMLIPCVILLVCVPLNNNIPPPPYTSKDLISWQNTIRRGIAQGIGIPLPPLHIHSDTRVLGGHTVRGR